MTHPRVLARVAPLLVALLVPLTTTACGQSKGDGKIDTVFDPCAPLVIAPVDGSAREKESVFRGVALWNDTAGSQLSVQGDGTLDSDDDDADSDAADSAPVIPLHFDEAGSNFHGYYDDVGAIVYINDDMDDDRQRAITIAHEIGHAFGLLHVDVDDDASVMNDGNLETAPNDFDVDALRALWGACGP